MKTGEGKHASARPARSPKNRDEMRGLVFAAAAHLACDLKNCAGGDIPWPVLVLFVPGSPHVTLIELRLAPRFVPGLLHVFAHSRVSLGCVTASTLNAMAEP